MRSRFPSTVLACGMAVAAIGTATSAPAQAPSPSAPAAPSSAAGVTYRSPLENYRRFSDEPVASWRQANDLVGQIGGWKAYAREAASGSAPAAPASGARP